MSRNGEQRGCVAGNKCGWDGMSHGCTTPGCFGPAIARMNGGVFPQKNCKHEWINATSTFGADQGWMCRRCWTAAPEKIQAELYVEAAEKALERAKIRAAKFKT